MKFDKRLQELDFAKGVLILLMVVFHLGYFNSCYPKLTECVYAFHMSGFLLISGYLCSLEKTKIQFVNSFRGVLIPYLFFEVLYLLAISFVGKYVGASNMFEGNAFDFVFQILTNPIGTYWYLHTLMFCMSIFYIGHCCGINSKANICLSSLLLFVMSMFVKGLLWDDIIYFIIGISCRLLDFPIVEKLKSLFMFIVFCAILFFADSFCRYSFVGIGLTITSLGLMFAVMYKMPLIVKNTLTFVGRNSLSIVLFSPFFVIFTKIYYSWFRFDQTVVLWMIVSLILVCGLCIISSKVLDMIKISKFLLGKNMYSAYS